MTTDEWHDWCNAQGFGVGDKRRLASNYFKYHLWLNLYPSNGVDGPSTAYYSLVHDWLLANLDPMDYVMSAIVFYFKDEVTRVQVKLALAEYVS
jgi:hypothetical protein